MKLKLPVVGVLFHKTAMSKFSRTLGTLLSSGVPILGGSVGLIVVALYLPIFKVITMIK